MTKVCSACMGLRKGLKMSLCKFPRSRKKLLLMENFTLDFARLFSREGREELLAITHGWTERTIAKVKVSCGRLLVSHHVQLL